MRLKEFVLLRAATGQQQEDLAGVRGTFALWDGWRSCIRSGDWKLRAEKLGPETKHMLLVMKMTSHQEWPKIGKNLRETSYTLIGANRWTPLT